MRRQAFRSKRLILEVSYTISCTTPRILLQVVDIGPIEATTKRQKTIPIPRIAGGAIVVAGILLVIAGSKHR